MPLEGGAGECHLCHMHDHAPGNTLVRTHPLRESNSRKNTTLVRPHHSRHHHHHHHKGDGKHVRVSSSQLAQLTDRSHSLPGSRSGTIAHGDVVSTSPDATSAHQHSRQESRRGSTNSREEYNGVLAALMETRTTTLTPNSNGGTIQREPDLLTALPHTQSRNSTISRTDERGERRGSNVTLAQDTEQDYYLHVHGARYKDEARKQRFNIQTVLLIGCYTMLFVVAIIVGVVLCQQNGWLGLGNGHNDDSSSSNSLGGADNRIRDGERGVRGRGARNRGGRPPGPTIDYDYADDGPPPRINTASVFPGVANGGRNTPPGREMDPLRTVNFLPPGQVTPSNPNQPFNSGTSNLPNNGLGSTNPRGNQAGTNGGNRIVGVLPGVGSGKSFQDGPQRPGQGQTRGGNGGSNDRGVGRLDDSLPSAAATPNTLATLLNRQVPFTPANGGSINPQTGNSNPSNPNPALNGANGNFNTGLRNNPNNGNTGPRNLNSSVRNGQNSPNPNFANGNFNTGLRNALNPTNVPNGNFNAGTVNNPNSRNSNTGPRNLNTGIPNGQNANTGFGTFNNGAQNPQITPNSNSASGNLNPILRNNPNSQNSNNGKGNPNANVQNQGTQTSPPGSFNTGGRTVNGGNQNNPTLNIASVGLFNTGLRNSQNSPNSNLPANNANSRLQNGPNSPNLNSGTRNFNTGGGTNPLSPGSNFNPASGTGLRNPNTAGLPNGNGAAPGFNGASTGNSNTVPRNFNGAAASTPNNPIGNFNTAIGAGQNGGTRNFNGGNGNFNAAAGRNPSNAHRNSNGANTNGNSRIPGNSNGASGNLNSVPGSNSNSNKANTNGNSRAPGNNNGANTNGNSRAPGNNNGANTNGNSRAPGNNNGANSNGNSRAPGNNNGANSNGNSRALGNNNRANTNGNSRAPGNSNGASGNLNSVPGSNSNSNEANTNGNSRAPGNNNGANSNGNSRAPGNNNRANTNGNPRAPGNSNVAPGNFNSATGSNSNGGRGAFSNANSNSGNPTIGTGTRNGANPPARNFNRQSNLDPTITTFRPRFPGGTKRTGFEATGSGARNGDARGNGGRSISGLPNLSFAAGNGVPNGESGTGSRAVGANGVDRTGGGVNSNFRGQNVASNGGNSNAGVASNGGNSNAGNPNRNFNAGGGRNRGVGNGASNGANLNTGVGTGFGGGLNSGVGTNSGGSSSPTLGSTGGRGGSSNNRGGVNGANGGNSDGLGAGFQFGPRSTGGRGASFDFNVGRGTDFDPGVGSRGQSVGNIRNLNTGSANNGGSGRRNNGAGANGNVGNFNSATGSGAVGNTGVRANNRNGNNGGARTATNSNNGGSLGTNRNTHTPPPAATVATVAAAAAAAAAEGTRTPTTPSLGSAVTVPGRNIGGSLRRRVTDNTASPDSSGASQGLGQGFNIGSPSTFQPAKGPSPSLSTSSQPVRGPSPGPTQAIQTPTTRNWNGTKKELNSPATLTTPSNKSTVMMKVTRRPVSNGGNTEHNWSRGQSGQLGSRATVLAPLDGMGTPLKVLQGFTVQRGEVVAATSFTNEDPDMAVIRPAHDVVFHINPKAPDGGVSLVRHPDQSNPQPQRRKMLRRRPESMRETISMGGSGSNSRVLRRWEHMDHQGTLSRGLVRSDGSFAFTNCRPPEGCLEDDGGS